MHSIIGVHARIMSAALCIGLILLVEVAYGLTNYTCTLLGGTDPGRGVVCTNTGCTALASSCPGMGNTTHTQRYALPYYECVPVEIALNCVRDTQQLCAVRHYYNNPGCDGALCHTSVTTFGCPTPP